LFIYLLIIIIIVNAGDMAPTTIAGRAIASLCCILGILATALPISIISNNFTLEYQRYLQKKEEFLQIEKLKARRLKELKRQKQLRDAKARESGPRSVLKRLGSIYSAKLKDEAVTQTAYNENASSQTSIGADSVDVDRKIDKSDKNFRKNPLLPETDVELVTVEENESRFQDTLPSDDLTIDGILAFSEGTVNQLDIETLQNMFQTLRSSYISLRNKHNEVSKLLRELESLAMRAYEKSLQRSRSFTMDESEGKLFDDRSEGGY